MIHWHSMFGFFFFCTHHSVIVNQNTYFGTNNKKTNFF